MTASSDASPRRMLWLRHGRTAWNHEGRAQGHADVALDDVGLTQARAVAPYVAAYTPSLLVSSDLARAAQTATIVAETCGLAVETDPGLREFGLDEARVGLTLAEYAEQHPAAYAVLAAGHAADIPGRESVAGVLDRFLPAVERVVDGLASGECAVLVSHGASMRVALAAFLGWPEEALAGLGSFANCGFAVLEESTPSFNPGPSRWRLTGFNLGSAATPGPDFVNPAGGR